MSRTITVDKSLLVAIAANLVRLAVEVEHTPERKDGERIRMLGLHLKDIADGALVDEAKRFEAKWIASERSLAASQTVAAQYLAIVESVTLARNCGVAERADEAEDDETCSELRSGRAMCDRCATRAATVLLQEQIDSLECSVALQSEATEKWHALFTDGATMTAKIAKQRDHAWTVIADVDRLLENDLGGFYLSAPADDPIGHVRALLRGLP